MSVKATKAKPELALVEEPARPRDPYDFDDIKIPKEMLPPPPTDLRTMLGADSEAIVKRGRDGVERVFVVRPPSLNGLLRLLDGAKNIQQRIAARPEEEDAFAHIRVMALTFRLMAAELLRVSEADATERFATEEEVGEYFDIPQLQEIVGQFTGLKASASGEV